MKYTIDRFEGDTAVLEGADGTTVDIPRILIPKNASEGDCLITSNDGTFFLDAGETERRKSEIENRFKHLFGKSDK